jgi:mRNA interferase RelE/StbE
VARYSVLVKKTAADELSRIPKKELLRIIERIRSLEENPRPFGCEKLSAQERYRIRQGNYRIVYSIDDDGRTVEVFKIGHRREVYRR